jgi:hypothetical protein
VCLSRLFHAFVSLGSPFLTTYPLPRVPTADHDQMLLLLDSSLLVLLLRCRHGRINLVHGRGLLEYSTSFIVTRGMSFFKLQRVGLDGHSRARWCLRIRIDACFSREGWCTKCDSEPEKQALSKNPSGVSLLGLPSTLDELIVRRPRVKLPCRAYRTN